MQGNDQDKDNHMVSHRGKNNEKNNELVPDGSATTVFKRVLEKGRSLQKQFSQNPLLFVLAMFMTPLFGLVLHAFYLREWSIVQAGLTAAATIVLFVALPVMVVDAVIKIKRDKVAAQIALNEQAARFECKQRLMLLKQRALFLREQLELYKRVIRAQIVRLQVEAHAIARKAEFLWIHETHRGASYRPESNPSPHQSMEASSRAEMPSSQRELIDLKATSILLALERVTERLNVLLDEVSTLTLFTQQLRPEHLLEEDVDLIDFIRHPPSPPVPKENPEKPSTSSTSTTHDGDDDSTEQDVDPDRSEQSC